MGLLTVKLTEFTTMKTPTVMPINQFTGSPPALQLDRPNITHLAAIGSSIAMAPPKFPRKQKDEDKQKQKQKRKQKRKHKHKHKEKEEEQDEDEDEDEEENQASDDTSSTGEEMTDSEFERQLSAIEAAREDIRKQRQLRKERFSLMFSEYQEIIDEMDRSLEKAEAANERYQNILRLLDEQCNRSFQGYEKISKLTQTARSPTPPYCELSLNSGRAESEPVSALRKSPNGLRSVDKFPKRLGICDVDVAERPKASSPDALKPLESSPAKCDSSSDSSRSSSSVNATPRFGCKAVVKKPPPLVPRLDLSGTGARAGAVMENSSSALQQKPTQLQCDQYENPGRRTSRRPDSARLISADDHFGNNIDSARIMLSRIKRRAKGGSCGGETINEVSVTSSANDTNSIVKKPSDDIGQNGDGPSIREIVELAVVQTAPESVATENTCKDVACRTPVHVLRRSMSPPVAKSCNPESEMFVTCNAAESAPKAQETVGGDAINLQASRQETRTQILLWPTREKLLTLKTLNNTMFLWEDHPAKCGAVTSDGNVDLVLSSLTAAKESQRRLFDNLDGVPGVPRRSICCSAVRELVRAYRPERLVPTSFINDHFVSQSLQHTVMEESFMKLASAETLRSAQDSEAADFWQALVHHVVSVADHKMATADQSAKEYAEVLLHEMREVDIVGDAKLARLELKAFLTRCFRLQPLSGRFTLPTGKDSDIHDFNTTCTQEDSAASKEHEIASGRPVRDIVVTRGKNYNNSELPLVASKHSRRSSLSSIFNSLKFWKRKPQKLATDMDYLSMLGMDRSQRPQTSHDRKRYGFSLEI